ncbi:phytoene/squalene synthase family protein [Desertifilum sp. FACHB-1129]|uniref:Phytoene synthase n=1 Tax=Desertifilum tharense IPPAS B-1220 TaxID=1781255 RepID=A0A1E5QG42_9CYAN|nr:MULTISPECIES: phytoene/squalene synthase family protein [Desertifilum]MDA0210336.1 phytoene/squalene synthase family protein [Cyanobacteria bacterium FC1]MBD2310283.1 phytoene/squalene synthase family protein [Desertifilum sp. FACHB-1129]MBD2322659.1 phytoene/squalene synthase family protein [Desertifilum sp. FACHB-866]MBD2333537.1 phytoene/squalene synthase family protein [Desertifilum sp. FACHB-868]OEJ73557.1 phytoene synthase [Desertifilum tharense IPPAS B-1220]
MDLRTDALEILKETSRTFYIPINQLPPRLQEAVASAYLCMRAIDEIEDHPTLDNPTKAKLLRAISLTLQAAVDGFSLDAFVSDLSPYKNTLEEVTVRIREWALLAPESIAPRIWDATAAMSDRMAYWADRNWRVDTEADLDRYTFGVAGAVGLLLSDLWSWYDGTQTNRTQAIGFGRGLQAVNILRNHQEDGVRGVSFLPEGWQAPEMFAYAQRNLALADAYTDALPVGPALTFCRIPLALAHGTLDALANGKEKLSRSDVMALLEQLSQK